MTEYPVEVSGAVSALSNGELQALRRAPFQQHLRTAGFVGESGVKRICSGTGVIFMGNTPVGPFSGTLQTNTSGGAGSGGPLSLSCPYTPIGYGGLVAAGHCRIDGTSTTNLRLDYNFTPVAGKNYTVKVRSRWAQVLAVSNLGWTASTRTLGKSGAAPFSSYTFTGNDWIYTGTGAGVQTGWYKIQSKTSNDFIVLTPDASILSTTDIAVDTIGGNLHAATDAFYISGATVSADGFTITKIGGFTSYVLGADDSIEVLSSTGYTPTGFALFPNFVKILARTNDTITLEEPLDMAATNTDLNFIVHRRTSFSSASFTGSASTNNLTLGSALSFTPRIGDVYYIWEDYVDATSPELLASNNPEKVPTRTQAFSTASWHPYESFVKRYPATYGGYQALATYPQSPDNSQMNHYWWGLFQTGPEVLSDGSEIVLTFNGDITYQGTPYIYEALLIPNFDPDADWVKSLSDTVRIPSYALWLQSDPITLTGVRDMTVKLVLRSNGPTTINVTPLITSPPNFGFQMSGEIELSQVGGIVSSQVVTKYSLGARSASFSQTDFDPTAAPIRWTFLHKFEHPVRRNHPGFHGYYPGEPFSVTTGHGGNILHYRGTPTSPTALPTAPRARLSRFAVDLYANGESR